PRDQLHPTPLAGAGPSAPGDAKFGPPVTGSEKWYEKLVYMADGVLFEDDVLQIGLKSEYQNNVGRLAMYFGNKTQSQLQNFSVATQVPPEVAVSTAMALASTIAPVTQVQQLFNIECRRQFSAPVLIRVAFTSTGGPQSFVLRAPVTLNKFVEPISLAGPDFFGRWKQIGGPPKEVQVIFAANSAGQNAIPAVKRLVAGFRFGVLVGVDPNLNNVVGAGILSVAGGKIGCLLRLEPNFDKKVRNLRIVHNQAPVDGVVSHLTSGGLGGRRGRGVWGPDELFAWCGELCLALQMFRLTVRSTDESVSETIKSLLVASLTTLV
ncbi:MAG: Coatomer/clathrin adaptor appendage, Ig-like subdomain-containing protein, partial [Olpidium bornovanus]